MPNSSRILILEDSVLVAMELEAMLRERGFRPVTAGSIAAARHHVAAEPVQAALLDMLLPDGTAHDLACELHGEGCAVAILSATDCETIPEALAFAGHFRKPVDPSVVLRWIEQRLPPADRKE